MKFLSLVEGITLDPQARDRIAFVWNRLRILAAAPAIPVAIGAAVLYDAKLYLIAALLALVLGMAIRHRDQPRPAVQLMLDTLGTWLVVELIGVPPTTLGIPFTVMWVGAWLTTRGWPRLALMLTGAVAYAVAAFAAPFPVPLPDTIEARVLGGLVGAYYVALMFSALIATIDVFRARQVSLAEARDELQRLIASKDEFVASVSHELRTPLTGVVGFASELNRSWHAYSDTDRRDMVRLIAEQGEDVAEIIDDLLIAARAGAGTLTVNLEDIDVLDVVTSMAHMEHLECDIDQHVLPAHADPARLRQVLRNLITNARRYGGTRRWLEVGQDHQTIHIRMCDDGEGIPGPDPERVFRAYERSHEAIGQPGSVGLGLAVARTLARLMGGDLTYRREQSTTIFECTLPASRSIGESDPLRAPLAS